jgi:hypothetical protein
MAGLVSIKWWSPTVQNGNASWNVAEVDKTKVTKGKIWSSSQRGEDDQPWRCF